MVKTALKVREILKEQGLACSIANARFVQPMDTELLREAAGKYSLIVTMEENVHSGGFGEHVAAWYAEQDLDTELLQGPSRALINIYSRENFLRYYLGFDIPFADEEECAALAEDPRVQAMSGYPYEGSVQKIGDCMVVKLG